MEMLNRAIEGASDYRGMMEKLEAEALQQANMLRMQAAMQGGPDRGESVQANPLPLGMQRQPGENRAAHRARLKRERREAKA